MHLNEQVYIDVLRIHIQPPKMPVCLTKQAEQMHIVNLPAPVNKAGLKTFIISLIDIFAGNKVFHKIKCIIRIPLIIQM